LIAPPPPIHHWFEGLVDVLSVKVLSVTVSEVTVQFPVAVVLLSAGFL
jgi:hypothetical protein